MPQRSLKLLGVLMVLSCANTAPADETTQTKTVTQDLEKDDLQTAASNAYPDRYSDWSRYPSGYGGGSSVTGYGTVDDRYNYGNSGSYDNSYGYSGYDSGYPGYRGYSGGAGYSSFGRGGYSGAGYSGAGYSGGSYGYGGNGGYGGYTGNGGLNSYYSYNNPSYQGANHLGYGYYKKPGYGNIYNSGITPNLVTGYRGYSRK